MIDLFSTVLAFVVALSILIAVHEYGHFLVARLSGVKVLRFSIGFGKPLWARRRGPDQTEYVIAAIPLGGYVKMLDEREGEVAEEELPRAFNRQPVHKRMAIIAAGPVFNLIFAVLAYWVMFVSGVPGIRPIVGDVEPGSVAAHAGVTGGVEIVAVGDRTTPTWNAVFEELLPSALRKESIEVVAERDGVRENYYFAMERIEGEPQAEMLPKAIGLVPHRPTLPPVIGEVLGGSVAERAGLTPGDRVVAANDQPVDDWEQLVLVVRDSPGKLVDLRVSREGVERSVSLRPDRFDTSDGPIGRIGAAPQVDEAMFAHLRTEVRYGPVAAVSEAVGRTWDMSVLTLEMFGKMLVGQASLDNISGPITIARYAKTTASAGLLRFIEFLAAVSLSLAVLNLLPIPVLDGGHLMFCVVELVRRRPVSEAAELAAQKVGIAVILTLMMLALYNDFARLAG